MTSAVMAGKDKPSTFSSIILILGIIIMGFGVYFGYLFDVFVKMLDDPNSEINNSDLEEFFGILVVVFLFLIISWVLFTVGTFLYIIGQLWDRGLIVLLTATLETGLFLYYLFAAYLINVIRGTQELNLNEAGAVVGLAPIIIMMLMLFYGWEVFLFQKVRK